MQHEAEGRTVDYSNKPNLAHEEFLLPQDAPDWAKQLIANRSVAGAAEAFWNMVEAFEKRSDAQLAKEFIIALPIELSRQQNIGLMRQFVADQVLARGQVADWVYHDDPGNPHVHLMTSLRPIVAAGFGSKKVAVRQVDGSPLRTADGKIQYRLWAGEKAEFLEQRSAWLDLQNQHLALAGLEVRVDGRSYTARGLDIVATPHIGGATAAAQRKSAMTGNSVALRRLALLQSKRNSNARRIEARPEIVLDLLTSEKSVFDERDVAKVLHRYIDEPEPFQRMLTRVLASAECLRLDVERVDLLTGLRVPPKLTTRSMIRLECGMIERAMRLAGASSHGVGRKTLAEVLARHDNLSDEQRTAIAHVAGAGRIAAVVGRAGAGKTTMMRAAREAWEAAGYRVIGGALAGKAAEGLASEAGIPSYTLASWELRWNKGNDLLDERSVLVLDEAGMVGSRQMAGFVEAVSKAGAKLVLVGDPEQLQPIEAGAAFRAIADRTGYVELGTIYRQRQDWMRVASLDLATGRTDKAILAYAAKGKVIGKKLKADAMTKLIEDWDRYYDPRKSTLILAHLRRDVRDLNKMAREALIKRGTIETGHVFQTEDGPRHFAAGEQIVFLRNDNALGVKNGLLGKVIEAASGRVVVEFGEGDDRRRVEILQQFYRNIDHGYATTIHKSQGATVDRVKVMASLSLNRHLAYVALTRHREDVTLYYGTQSFAMSGGLEKVLARREAKQTTLDFGGGRIYAQALRFANNRGLHLVRAARTLISDHLQWTVRQKVRLLAFGERLRTLGDRLASLNHQPSREVQALRKAEPLVRGTRSFALTTSEAVGAKLQGDRALTKQWELVSDRIRLVYADPKSAFQVMPIATAFFDQKTRAEYLLQVEHAPASYGPLQGHIGFFASRAERRTREIAETNAPALRRDLERYFLMRDEATKRLTAEETAIRQRASIDIPALSPAAEMVLAQVCDALARSDLPAALEFAYSDLRAKAEIDAFNETVKQRFGEQAFVGKGNLDTGEAAFKAVSGDLAPAAQQTLASAWPKIWIAQQLAMAERRIKTAKETPTLRPTQRHEWLLK